MHRPDFHGCGYSYSEFVREVPAHSKVVDGTAWFLDQNLTTLLINQKANNQKKPCGYHLVLFVYGVFIHPVCSFFGIFFTHAAIIRSLSNMACSRTQGVVHRDEEKGSSASVKVPDAVAEQRVTQLAFHVLIAVLSTLASALKLVPQSVLYGVFLGFVDCCKPPLRPHVAEAHLGYEQVPCIKFRGIELNWLHGYTFIQVICLTVLFAVAFIKAVAAVFPPPFLPRLHCHCAAPPPTHRHRA